MRKEGPAFDLPIALAVLAASSVLSEQRLEGIGVVGELSLDGGLRGRAARSRWLKVQKAGGAGSPLSAGAECPGGTLDR